jgi:hypothetical protein
MLKNTRQAARIISRNAPGPLIPHAQDYFPALSILQRCTAAFSTSSSLHSGELG